MSVRAPHDVVRLLFDARAAGDVRRVLALVDPDVRARFPQVVHETIDGVRVELDAHRIEPDGPEDVLVTGRIRVIDGGSLSDSPATWRFVVRHGRVVDLARTDARGRRLRPAA